VASRSVALCQVVERSRLVTLLRYFYYVLSFIFFRLFVPPFASLCCCLFLSESLDVPRSFGIVSTGCCTVDIERWSPLAETTLPDVVGASWGPVWHGKKASETIGARARARRGRRAAPFSVTGAGEQRRQAGRKKRKNTGEKKNNNNNNETRRGRRKKYGEKKSRVLRKVRGKKNRTNKQTNKNQKLCLFYSLFLYFLVVLSVYTERDPHQSIIAQVFCAL